MKTKYTLNDLKPINSNTVEKKITNSLNYARVLLWIKLRSQQNTPNFTAKDIIKFFKFDSGYAYRVIEFFVENDIVRKIKRSTKDVVYIPINREIKVYIKIAEKKFGKRD